MQFRRIRYLIAWVICIPVLGCFNAFAQEGCDVKLSAFSKIPALDVRDIYCIAQHTNRKATLIFTFAAWCAPCRAHLPNAIKLAKDYGLEFYVLVPEAEADAYVAEALKIVKLRDSTVNVAVLKDMPYGAGRNTKYGKFLDEIIPAPFPKIHDYSKYILLNKEAKVIMVTSWKDNKGNNWRNDSAIIRKRLIPLL
jgi:thiol-disulfide isomerase/thioredoxin